MGSGVRDEEQEYVQKAHAAIDSDRYALNIERANIQRRKKPMLVHCPILDSCCMTQKSNNRCSKWYIVDNLKGLLHAFIYILHISSYIWLYTYARARCASYCIQHKYTVSIHLGRLGWILNRFFSFLSLLFLSFSHFFLFFFLFTFTFRALFFPLFSLFLCLYAPPALSISRVGLGYWGSVLA